MRKEEIIRKAKIHAAKWNEFRLAMKDDFAKNELRELAKQHHLPYYDRMVSYIFSKKINVTEVGMGYCFNISSLNVMKYRFNDTPIHYSTLVEMIEAATSFRRTHAQKVAADCIAKPKAEDGKLVSFSDAELVKELRKRGFEVIAKKTIEL